MTLLHEYETTFIVRPEAMDDEVTRLRSRFEEIVTDRGGQLMVFEDWGRRRLAYTIERHEHGRFFYLNYMASADAPSEIERITRIEDTVVRYLTVRLTENGSFEDCFGPAVERQKKRINRGNRSDDDRGDRRRRATAHDSIKSPSPIRYQNADGTGDDMTEEAVSEAAPAAAESAAAESTAAEPAAEAVAAEPAEAPVAEAAPATSEEAAPVAVESPGTDSNE
jgi:small subunit ribosomal protein S6